MINNIIVKVIWTLIALDYLYIRSKNAANELKKIENPLIAYCYVAISGIKEAI